MEIKNKNWQDFFKEESCKSYYSEILKYLKERALQGAEIYPPQKEIFSAYEDIDPQNIKVVIIGQDPYHGESQAHGLAFSVNKGIKIPPSLRNMYKELEESVDGFEIPDHGYLKDWSNQGVFLLNNVLTVEKSSPDCHKKIGWEKFTNETIKYINKHCENVVFVLWGGNAKKKEKMIDKEKHCVLMSAHPSPLSSYRGFFGCNHFNLINDYLISKNKEKIDWNLKK